MTPKEAFRKLSHKFHGKGPGKMKQEKRQKQFQEELKLKQMNAGDTPLMAMEKIRDAQAKLAAPYLVISGHIKPGQTSDPRSGFATVEKEPVGSLTPMLGDNKTIGSLTPMLGDKKVHAVYTLWSLSRSITAKFFCKAFQVLDPELICVRLCSFTLCGLCQ